MALNELTKKISIIEDRLKKVEDRNEKISELMLKLLDAVKDPEMTEEKTNEIKIPKPLPRDL